MLDRRLVIVSGKGGVGKSAVSAGLAILAQRTGRRVLAVDMTGDGGLSGHFGTGPLAFKPREVRPGLHAMRIVRSEALLEYLSLQLRLPGMGRFGAVARAFDALATAAPAGREIITIGKILREVREERWDLVVADGPPTGQIGSYLRAPMSIAELVPTGRISTQAAWMRETLSNPTDTSLIVVTLPEELPSTETLETVEWLAKLQGFEVTVVPVEPDGVVDPGRLLAAVRDDTAVVSVMAANNEIGAVQPLDVIGPALAERGVPLHTDAVQAFGRVPLDLDGWGVGALSLSAHKINGPKGVGVLMLRRDLPAQPLLHGGGQERGVRSGTFNVAGIVGCGAAVRTPCEIWARAWAIARWVA